MKIDQVDFFYLSMPVVKTAADGSQDALLVRVVVGGHVGWGECEAAPLPSIAAYMCPMSHGVCRPVSDSVLGETLNDAADIRRIADKVAYNSMDLLQAMHTWSGIEVALWDALGKACSAPVWSLLGYRASHPKTPYASVLFGDDPSETLSRAKDIRSDGFLAAKFGWGPFGADLTQDIAHIEAAREGLGQDGILLIDAGQIFGEDDVRAARRIDAMSRNRVTFFEEPFHGSAYGAYGRLAKNSGSVKLAGGEAAHNRYMAENLIDFGGVGYIQIDCGRIGGIGPAYDVAEYARPRGVTYINHTFTSNLALSASLQPFAGLEDHSICEYPTALQPLAVELTSSRLLRDGNGKIAAPDAPGLGIEIAPAALDKYRVEVEIKVNGKSLFVSPTQAA